MSAISNVRSNPELLNTQDSSSSESSMRSAYSEEIRVQVEPLTSHKIQNQEPPKYAVAIFITTTICVPILCLAGLILGTTAANYFERSGQCWKPLTESQCEQMHEEGNKILIGVPILLGIASCWLITFTVWCRRSCRKPE